MADEVKKVLGLDAVSLIKADLLNEIKQESELITKEYRDAIENKANDILNNFETSSEADKQIILDQLTELGQKDETLAEGVESLRSAIQSLNNKVDGLDQPESVLSDNDVKKIITASLIQKSFWSNDSMGSPTVAGNEIVGLVGTFGKIKTENLEGTLIEGKTVQSVPDSEGNIAWQLNNAGNGHLANGNISWNENGDVTFGEGVKIKWDNVDEKPNIPEGGITESEKEEIITTVIDRSGITAETITGKTIQSSESISEEDTDPTWQITNDGAGYLAKKNITWESDGTLNANINGSFSGGNNGNVGDDVMSWDENNIYFKKNVVFDDNCVLTWGSSGDTSSGGEIPGGNSSDGLTEERVTEITKNLISTDTIVAENMIAACLNTSAVNEPETFQPVYNVEDHVEIEGNYIRVRTYENEDVVTISSDEVQNYFSPDAFKVTSDIDGNEGFITIQFVRLGNGKWYNKNAIDQSELSLGFIDTNGYADIRIQLRLVQIGTGAVDTQNYTMNPTASFADQPKLQILKYDPINDTYIIHSQKTITDWVNTVFPNGFNAEDVYTFWTKRIKVEPMNRGIYKVKLSLPANSIEGTDMGTGQYQFRAWYSITNVNRGSGSFSVIGKNGVSLMSESCNIFMNNDKIELTAGNLKTNPNSPSLYGIRITPNGMYYANGGSTWTAWNPSN